jgi:hypothetical protein
MHVDFLYLWMSIYARASFMDEHSAFEDKNGMREM